MADVYFKTKKTYIKGKYGLNNEAIADNTSKLKNQSFYMKNNFAPNTGQSFFDLTYSPLHQPKKYISELNNRIATQIAVATQKNFKTSIFMTITLPSEMKPTKQIKQKTKSGQKILVDNPKFIGNSDTYIRDGLEYLGYKWSSFLRREVFNKIFKKYDKRMFYFSVKEPHLDGSPHLHILGFIPNEFLEEVEKVFHLHFKNTQGLDFRVLNGYKQSKAYILKYIFKSFKKENVDNFDLITHWFVINRVRRFTSSRGVIPLYLYRKIHHHHSLKDMHFASVLYETGDLFMTEDTIYFHNFNGIDKEFEVVFNKIL